MEFICLNCLFEFTENEAIIKEFGTGATLSKIEDYACPECESLKIKECNMDEYIKVGYNHVVPTLRVRIGFRFSSPIVLIKL